MPSTNTCSNTNVGGCWFTGSSPGLTVTKPRLVANRNSPAAVFHTEGW